MNLWKGEKKNRAGRPLGEAANIIEKLEKEKRNPVLWEGTMEKGTLSWPTACSSWG